MKTIDQHYDFFKNVKQLLLSSKVKLFLLCLLTATISCTTDEDSEDDDTPSVSTPTVSYDSTTLDATFSTLGNSSAPTLNWNGDQGSFSLVNTIPGVTINTTTGVVSWNRLLPPGTNNLQLIAANSAGQTSVNLTINNPLRGVFTGTYGSSLFFQFEFLGDGNVNIKATNEASPDIASGTYTINDDEILVNYLYDISPDPFSILGTLVQTESSASLSGKWYFAADADPAEEGGEFTISL